LENRTKLNGRLFANYLIIKASKFITVKLSRRPSDLKMIVLTHPRLNKSFYIC